MEPDFSKIRAFAFDVDGVMTDGGILADLEGQLFRTFDAKDGFGIRMARMKGYPIGVITGGRSGSIRARFTGCGIPPRCLSGIPDQDRGFRGLLPQTWIEA